MSADNGWILRENCGMYVLQEYCASLDEYPPIDDAKAKTFETLQDAMLWYGVANPYSEYGLRVELGKDEPLIDGYEADEAFYSMYHDPDRFVITDPAQCWTCGMYLKDDKTCPVCDAPEEAGSMISDERFHKRMVRIIVLTRAKLNSRTEMSRSVSPIRINVCFVMTLRRPIPFGRTISDGPMPLGVKTTLYSRQIKKV